MKKLLGVLSVCILVAAGCADREPSFSIVDKTASEKPVVAATQPPAKSATTSSSASPATPASAAPASSEASKESGQAGVQTEEAKETTESRTPDVIFVPTPQDVVDKMLEMAQVSKDDLVYDLGCGDGRIVVTAAQKYGCKAIGYDIDPQRIKESQENVQKHGVGDLVQIQQKDIFTLDLSEANVITLYLLPRLNVKLIPQLEKLKPGSRIVSHDFRMKGFKPEKTVTLTSDEDQAEHKIFLWTTPLKKKESSTVGQNAAASSNE
jgi:protein-L-isoaspartate O-methyltransferase